MPLRKKIAVLLCVVVGLTIGFALKRMTIGLLLGILLGVTVTGLIVSNRK